MLVDAAPLDQQLELPPLATAHVNNALDAPLVRVRIRALVGLLLRQIRGNDRPTILGLHRHPSGHVLALHLELVAGAVLDVDLGLG